MQDESRSGGNLPDRRLIAAPYPSAKSQKAFSNFFPALPPSAQHLQILTLHPPHPLSPTSHPSPFR